MNGATREMTHKELKEAYRELVIKLDKIREVIGLKWSTPFSMTNEEMKIKSILESDEE